ncbi:hypothetical protein [Aestuariivirga sp.]|uniref:winged helix domain-containing protein n=1 Tax=Aestuariivirga sp. TaxID=2650926 RepID=UPI0035945BF8
MRWRTASATRRRPPKLTVIARRLPDGAAFAVRGRDAWALLELAMGGPKGVTPIDNPGPRWSGHVFNLKRRHGLDIETRHESHKGRFPGVHASYVLRGAVEIVSRSVVRSVPAFSSERRGSAALAGDRSQS